MKEEYEDFAKYGTLVVTISIILAANLPKWVGESVYWARWVIERVSYLIASFVILASLAGLADALIRKHLVEKEEKNKPIINFSEKIIEEFKEEEAPIEENIGESH